MDLADLNLCTATWLIVHKGMKLIAPPNTIDQNVFLTVGSGLKLWQIKKKERKINCF